ncbi:MAG: hypothetical protein SH868_19865 [Bythopirellula sp.]|nr:hypothetical protein [Bythopirellula sp.]
MVVPYMEKEVIGSVKISENRRVVAMGMIIVFPEKLGKPSELATLSGEP